MEHRTQGVEKCVIITGLSGAGKSTLMWTLVGLLKPQSGSVVMNGPAAELLASEDIVDSYFGGRRGGAS